MSIVNIKSVKKIENRRKSDGASRIMWNRSKSGTRDMRPCRRVCHETSDTLKELSKLASDRQIRGLIAIMETVDGELNLIITGQYHDDPLRASGALNKFQTLLDHYPDHPVLKL